MTLQFLVLNLRALGYNCRQGLSTTYMSWLSYTKWATSYSPNKIMWGKWWAENYVGDKRVKQKTRIRWTVSFHLRTKKYFSSISLSSLRKIRENKNMTVYQCPEMNFDQPSVKWELCKISYVAFPETPDSSLPFALKGPLWALSCIRQ